MTTLDTQVSLLTFLYNKLTQDASMQTLMGGTVRLYPVWAREDAEFPYLVHRLEIRPVSGGIYPEQKATYYLDIWFDCSDAADLLAVRKRIIELLDELRFSSAEVSNGEIHKSNADGFVPETEPDIWHYHLQFVINYWRKSETAAILAR